MMMVAVVASIGVCVGLIASLVRLFIGPTLYDRALAARLIIGQSALLCVAATFAAPATVGVEVALGLLLAGSVLLVAVLKFFQTRTFQTPLSQTLLSERDRTWT